MLAVGGMRDDTYKKFSDDPELRRDVADRIFELTYTGASSAA